MLKEHSKFQTVLKSYDWFKRFGHVKWWIEKKRILLSDQAFLFYIQPKKGYDHYLWARISIRSGVLGESVINGSTPSICLLNSSYSPV